MSKLTQQQLDRLAIAGGFSNNTSTGTVTHVPDNYTEGFLLSNNSFETRIILQIIDSFGNIFKWNDLPKGLESTDLESMLLMNGRLAFTRALGEYYLVRYTMDDYDQNSNVLGGRINEPKIELLNGAELNKFKHVEIKNNRWGFSLIHKIRPSIKALAEIERKMVINSRIIGKKLLGVNGDLLDQNVDLVNVEDEEQELSTALENSFNNFMSDSKMFKMIAMETASDLQVIDLDYKDISEELRQNASYFKNQILASLGMPSNNLENKSERVVSGEIELQNVFESSIIETMLDYRKKAANEINEMFGFNISVDYNEKLKSMVENKVEEVLPEKTEEVENE